MFGREKNKERKRKRKPKWVNDTLDDSRIKCHQNDSKIGLMIIDLEAYSSVNHLRAFVNNLNFLWFDIGYRWKTNTCLLIFKTVSLVELNVQSVVIILATLIHWCFRAKLTSTLDVKTWASKATKTSKKVSRSPNLKKKDSCYWERTWQP